MRSLIVGLDGSDDCEAAVRLGIEWAGRFESLLVGIGVVDEPTIRGSQPPAGMSRSYQPVYDQLMAEERRRVEQALEKFAIRCSEAQVACKLLEDEGQPCERIMHEARRYDLVMLGCRTHFRHGSDRRACQTLEKVLHNAPRPVVVVPTELSVKCENRVLVAYDGSLQAARALQAFLATGLQTLGPIEIVSIHKTSKVEAARTADHAAEFLRFHDLQAQITPVVSEEPAGKLFVEKAQAVGASLIVMGAYGQPKLTEYFLGSATCTALRDSTVPLFLYH